MKYMGHLSTIIERVERILKDYHGNEKQASKNTLWRQEIGNLQEYQADGVYTEEEAEKANVLYTMYSKYLSAEEKEGINENVFEVWSNKKKIKPSYTDFDYTKMYVYSFYFREQEYKVDTWKELLIKILSLMHTLHKEEFENILDIPGRRRQYFTHYPEKLHVAEEIDNTGIYTETKLGSNSIVGLCYDIIQLFGYSDDDLVIEAH
jgi:hypothetical protein